MRRRRFTEEQIIGILKEAEAGGKNPAGARDALEAARKAVAALA